MLISDWSSYVCSSDLQHHSGMPANDVVANLVGLRHLQDWIEAHRIPMVSIHTSGHASVSDLKRLVAAVDPRHLIPIHTFEREAYAERFGRATVLDAGEIGRAHV